MRRVFHVLFFCCVFYTRQIGNYVYFIVFFHGYFVRDGMDDCTSLRFALLSPFAQQSDAEAPTRALSIAGKHLLNCWLTFSYFKRSFSYQLCGRAQHGAREIFRERNRKFTRCMTPPFTIVRLIAANFDAIFSSLSRSYAI